MPMAANVFALYMVVLIPLMAFSWTIDKSLSLMSKLPVSERVGALTSLALAVSAGVGSLILLVKVAG